MEKHVLILFVFLAMIAAGGCNDSPSAQQGDENVISVNDADDAMNVAIAKAKETFHFFENNWKTMKNDGYSIKVQMRTSDGGEEHIWFNPIKIDGNQITAECANDPVDIPGLKYGDVKTLSRSLVSDWMIVVGNKCYGGYTIKVLADQRPDAAPAYEFVDVSK